MISPTIYFLFFCFLKTFLRFHFLIFTILCWCLIYNSTNQPYLNIYSLLSLLPLCHPTPPGHHRAPDWSPWATQQLLTSYPSYTWCYFLHSSHSLPKNEFESVLVRWMENSLGWRIPWTEHLGKLLSIGSHRIGACYTEWSKPEREKQI